MDIRIMKGDITSVDQGMILNWCADIATGGVGSDLSKMYPNIKRAYEGLWDYGNRIDLGFTQFVPLTPMLYAANAIVRSYVFPNDEHAASECFERSCLFLLEQPPTHRRLHVPSEIHWGINFNRDIMPVIEDMSFKYPQVTFVVWDAP